MISLAPIILFAYNRPWHTEQALEALSLNAEASLSKLYIYADGPKENASEEDLKKIDDTINVLNKKKWCKEVQIIVAPKNKGLADSVIDATTEIVNKYGRVITIEDDVVVGRYFLDFMNRSLEKYKIAEKVFMISGYSFPVTEFIPAQRCFFLPISTSQAWGTWSRAWNLFDTSAKDYELLKKNSKLRAEFNLGNSYDFSTILIMQMESDKLSSWAVRFRWSMFRQKGLILFPDKSLIKNIGWDNSGTHCNNENIFEDLFWENDYSVINYPAKIEIDRLKFRQIKQYFRAVFASEKKRNLVQMISGKIKSFVPVEAKKMIKTLISKDYRAEKLEEARLRSLPRFAETELLFLDKKIKIVDIDSFRFLKSEIFDQNIYQFKSDSHTPYIIDCGANIGLSIIYFKQLLPNSEIVGFEPDDKVFKVLEYNIESFKFSNIKLIKKACWHEDTTIEFYSEGADGGRAAIVDDTQNIIEVQTTRLRSYLNRKVDFLKIDIEGAELNVLKDCEDLLLNIQNLFVEYHSFVGQEQNLDIILTILKNAGFRYAIQQHGVVSHSPFIKIENQNNMDILLNISAYR